VQRGIGGISPRNRPRARGAAFGTPSGTNGFADLDASATEEDLDGLTVRVASIDDLIRMKLAAGRPQDLIAVEWLSALRDEVEERDS
jgi:hypothetical protein